mmetsp:Transcript_11702/g.50460  ORF Transcript_11702/g.50460 Transcript_11702/m.50460 type:complete len:271 (+) Transcript_11702:1863-2675(+)
MTSFQNFFSSSRDVATRGNQLHRRHEFTFQRLNDLRWLLHRTQTRVEVHSVGILASAQTQLPFVVCAPGVNSPGERQGDAVASRGGHVHHGLASDVDRGGNARERHVLGAHVDAELPVLVAAKRENSAPADEHQGVLQTHRRVDDLLLLTVPRVQLEQRRGESGVRVLRARGPHSELPAVVPPPDVYVFLLRYRDSVELPGYYALQVRLHLAHRLVPERRDVLWIALIRFRLVALTWHVIDAELSESVQAPRVHVPIRVHLRGRLGAEAH